VTPLLPPPLAEAKSQERDAVLLINRMRAMLLQVRQMEFAVATVATAVPATIWLSDDMPENSVWDVEVIVLAMATSGDAGAYRRIGRFSRLASTSSALVAVATPVADAEDAPAWDVTLTSSGNGVLLTVTGDAGSTVSWSALVRVRELKT
jgi:hypothetical protein